MADEGVIGERLNHLFATVHPAGRGPYTLREAADAINAEAGTSIISPAYLSQLRTGQRAEPSHSRLLAIARFFGVDPSYFNEDGAAEETDRHLEFLTAMRDAGVRSVALRAQGLSEASLAAVRAVIENARRLEGLRDGEDEPARLDRARSRCLQRRSGLFRPRRPRPEPSGASAGRWQVGCSTCVRQGWHRLLW
jgi:transcriptional regulator with XRE-family HTH domain